MNRILRFAACVGIFAGLAIPSAVPSAAAEKPDVVLFDFESPEAAKAWANLEVDEASRREPAAHAEVSPKGASQGQQALKITFKGGRLPAVAAPSPVADWSGYKTFRAHVTVDRPCLVVFRVMNEQSVRGGGTEKEAHSRWEKLALLQKGANEVVEVSPNYTNVRSVEIAMYKPREGETIAVDDLRLQAPVPKLTSAAHADYIYGPGKQLPGRPSIGDVRIPVLGTDRQVASVEDLAAQLKDQWVDPVERTVEQVEQEVLAQHQALQAQHPGAVLLTLRDGQKGFDPKAPEKAFAGWIDAETYTHPPATLTLANLANRGDKTSMEVALALRPALLKVDLTCIPQGATILAARLLLVRTESSAKSAGEKWMGARTLFVAQPVNRPWKELEVNNMEYARDQFWKETCGTHWLGEDPDILPIFLAHGPGGRGTSTWDFTAAVRYWTTDGRPNHGFAMYAGQGLSSLLHACSRESVDSKSRPALFVIYEPRKAGN